MRELCEIDDNQKEISYDIKKSQPINSKFWKSLLMVMHAI